MAMMVRNEPTQSTMAKCRQNVENAVNPKRCFNVPAMRSFFGDEKWKDVDA